MNITRRIGSGAGRAEKTTSQERVTKINKKRKVDADKRGPEIDDDRRLTRWSAENSRRKIKN
jgi:hypothetical protein